LSCENSILNKRLISRGDNYTLTDFDFLNEVSSRYEFILKDCKIPHIKIDTSYMNDVSICNLFKNLLIN